MKQLIIRECAFRACEEAGWGDQMLMEILREAFTGERPDWDGTTLPHRLANITSTERGLYEAIAPDIFASVREETTPDQIADDICKALGASGLFDEPSHFTASDWHESE